MIYKYNVILVKIPQIFAFRNKKDFFLNLYGKAKELKQERILKKKNKAGKIILLDFNTYITTVIKTVWCWFRERHIYQ